MNTPESSNSSRLLAYGTVACGATALLAGNVEAATIVNVNSSTYSSGLSDLGNFTTTSAYTKGYLQLSGGTGVSVPSADGGFVQRAASTTNVSFSGFTTGAFILGYGSSGSNGVLLNSSDNWFYAVANSNPAQRVWLQIQLGSTFANPTILKAVIPSFAGELPSASHAAAAVPETSSLALLSLGAVGLLKRRRRAA